eukprot:g26144.t1
MLQYVISLESRAEMVQGRRKVVTGVVNPQVDYTAYPQVGDACGAAGCGGTLGVHPHVPKGILLFYLLKCNSCGSLTPERQRNTKSLC